MHRRIKAEINKQISRIPKDTWLILGVGCVASIAILCTVLIAALSTILP